MVSFPISINKKRPSWQSDANKGISQNRPRETFPHIPPSNSKHAIKPPDAMKNQKRISNAVER